MSAPTINAYAAIRQTDNREWIDINTLEVLPELARNAADTTNKLIPLYAQQNPVIRIAKIEIREKVTP